MRYRVQSDRHIETTQTQATPAHDQWEDFMKKTLLQVHSLMEDLKDVGKVLSKEHLRGLQEDLVNVSTAFTEYVHSPHPEESHDLVRELHANVYHQIGNLLAAGQAVTRLYNKPKLKTVITETTHRLADRIQYLLHTDFDFARENFEVARRYNESPVIWCEDVTKRLSGYKMGSFSCEFGDLTSTEGLPFRVHAHPGIITLVLQELIINAEKAATEFAHSPALITLSQEGDQLIFRVQDTGRGMSSEEQATMFQKGVSQTNSSGMGLWQVQHLAEAFGVNVSCETSTLTKGTTMRVDIPLHTS